MRRESGKIKKKKKKVLFLCLHAKIKTKPNDLRLKSLFRVTKVAKGVILIVFRPFRVSCVRKLPGGHAELPPCFKLGLTKKRTRTKTK